MITVQEANDLVLRWAPRFDSVKYPIEKCLGMSLAENVLSERSQPPFHRVAMDGISIKLESFNAGQKKFKIQGLQRAGEPQKKLEDSSSCLEVMTGAVLPEGTDVVIRYEDLELADGFAIIKPQALQLSAYDNVHTEGSDHKKGDVVLAKGQILWGPQIGILAANGYSQVSVVSRPKIALISTGDELVDFNQTPNSYQIRKSNPFALRAVLQSFSENQIDFYHLEDEMVSIHTGLQHLLKQYEILIFTGGVSEGKFDFLPKVFSDLKIEKVFHKVSQRPGKPFWFGIGPEKQRVYALPGNPVSCLVCLRRYVIPSLSTFARENAEYATLSEEFKFAKSLTYFLPVSIQLSSEGKMVATPQKTNGSGDYGALAKSDGFIELPLEQDVFKKGEAFRLYRWHI